MAEITAVCSQRWTWTLIPPVSAWCDRRGYNGGGGWGSLLPSPSCHHQTGLGRRVGTGVCGVDKKQEGRTQRSRSRLGWGLVSGLSHPSRRGAASAAGSGVSPSWVLVPCCHRGLDAAPHSAHHQSPQVPQRGDPGAGIPQMALIQDPGDPAGRGQHVEVISPEKPQGEERGEGLVFACPAWVLSPPDKTYL